MGKTTQYQKTLNLYGNQCSRCGARSSYLRFVWNDLSKYRELGRTKFLELVRYERRSGRNTFLLLCTTCKQDFKPDREAIGDGETLAVLYERAKAHRRNPVKSESAVYVELNRLGIAHRFRTQVVLPPKFFVDFLDSRCKLIVEIDGSSHFNSDGSRTDYDQSRQRQLEQLGYRVLRFTNEQVKQDARAVARAIKDNCNC